jgi:hypothetical protein
VGSGNRRRAEVGDATAAAACELDSEAAAQLLLSVELVTVSEPKLVMPPPNLAELPLVWNW